MTTDSSPAPEGDPSEHSQADGPILPDDVWDRFLNDTERDIRSSAPKEPSARARVVARRLREEDERAAAEERRGPVRRRRTPGAPVAWRGGTTDAGRRASRRRRVLRGTVGTVLVVAFVLVLLAPSSAWSLVRGHGWRHDGPPAPAPTTPAHTPPATGPAVTERPFSV